jgi:hypothetical protein
VENANVRYMVSVAQSSKGTPRALLGEHGHQEIERMHRSQQCEQMHTPELRRAERPAGSTEWARIPLFIDKLVGDVWIEQRKQVGSARQR